MIEPRPSSPEEYARQDMGALVGYLLKQGVHYEDARDAAGEAMKRMCENWSSIENPKAWARTTAYHLAVDAIRRHRSEEEKGRRAASQASVVAAVAAADDLWMLKEEQRTVIDHIRSLPEAQRNALALHLDGFSNTEIAQIIGANPQTVGSNLRHAKRRLQTILETEGVYRPVRDAKCVDGGE